MSARDLLPVSAMSENTAALVVGGMEAEVARLREALVRYGVHDDGCNANDLDYLDDTPCTCGFRAAHRFRRDPVTLPAQGT